MGVCPAGSGPTKTLADVAGTYEDTKMKCCKTSISTCGPDMGWACFFCGPLPFSGTPVCKAGDNVWANYQVCANEQPRTNEALGPVSTFA